LHDLNAQHDLLQDVYNSCQEQYRMMYEENSAYLWAINNQQACDSLADEMAIADLQSQLQEIQKIKEEVARQIVLQMPGYA
jgi:hypothetical protein